MKAWQAPLLAGALCCSPALAQPAEDLDQVRADLARSSATIEQMQKALDALRLENQALQKRLDGVAGGTADAMPGPQPVRDGSTVTIDLSDTKGRDTASVEFPQSIDGRGWEPAPSGPIDRPVSSLNTASNTAFELNAGSGGGRASFAITKVSDGGGEAQNGRVPFWQNASTLTLSAPLAKEGDTSFATLDGLASGLKLGFEFTRFRGQVPTFASIEADPAIVEARRLCNQPGRAYAPGCTRIDRKFIETFVTEGEQRRLIERIAGQSIRRSLSWTLRGAVGYEEFSYFPLATLAKTTDKKIGWSLGAGMLLFPLPRTAATLDLDYQRSFEAKKSLTTCPLPAVGATTVSCTVGAVEPPDSKEKLILAPGLRHAFSIGNGLLRSLGISPRMEFDLLSDDFAVDVPLYFANSQKDGLIGGVRVGYKSKGDDVILGLFIGKAFSLTGAPGK